MFSTKVNIKVSNMVISMVSIKVSIMVSVKVIQNINKMKWMNHIFALRDFFPLLTLRFNFDILFKNSL